MSKLVDFSDCAVNQLKWYGGANGNKICIMYQDERYMLKFPSHPDKAGLLSYTNSCISEYLGCHILNVMGIPAQETLLGQYNGKRVVACKDMETSGFRLRDFASLKNSVITSEQAGYGIELSDVLAAIESQEVISSEDLLNFFWDMFVADAFIGNFDRHNGNWGFLVKESTGEVKIAPLFDCGSSLYPRIPEAGMIETMHNPQMTEDRLFVFPNSAIKASGKKINYMAFLSEAEEPARLAAIRRVASHIDMQKIHSVVNETPSLTNTEREFYNYMLDQRYERIILPVWERAKSLEIAPTLNQRIAHATQRAAELNADKTAFAQDDPEFQR